MPIGLTLTRDIPTGLGWLIGPYVTSVPRESLYIHTRHDARSAVLKRIATRIGHVQRQRRIQEVSLGSSKRESHSTKIYLNVAVAVLF